MAFVNAATDLSILLLPIRICWGLQLSRKRKLGVLVVLGLGLMYVVLDHGRDEIGLGTDASSVQLLSVWPVLSLSPLAAFREV